MSLVGERIRELRNDMGVSQQTFAKRLGVHKGHISTLERGASQPSDQLIKLISVETMANEDWLREGKGPKYEIWVEEFKALVAGSDEDTADIYRFMQLYAVKFNRLLQLLGDSLYDLVNDATLRPGDPKIAIILRNILKEIEGSVKKVTDEGQAIDDTSEYEDLKQCVLSNHQRIQRLDNAFEEINSRLNYIENRLDKGEKDHLPATAKPIP